MYGGPGKLGRGGGAGRGTGGGNKRNIHSPFHPSPRNSRPSPAAAARLSMGGAGASQRNRIASTPASGGAGSASSAAATEESFSLVTGNPLNFAMIIRLTPDLVEEITRAESEGCSARIKFDANVINPGGNVNVGGKDFRFTWSREPGDLCDIYEERQSGEGGNGLLVESGSAWRKLNVNRVLDESTTNHVKMRSKEAERKSKSRKAIVLDPGNPSMKNNVKQMAAAESTSSWRNAGAPFKKRKAEPPSVLPKSVQRSALTPTPPSKGRPSPSPPPPEQPVAPGSSAAGNFMKGHSDVEGTVSSQATNKHLSSERGAADRVIPSAGRGNQGQKTLKGAQPPDLRSMLVSLLGESSSKGMSLKALEKAIGDALPNSVRQIEPILKKIAIFQAPDRYILKPGIEIESFKKPSALSLGLSSPEDNRHSSPAHDEQPPAPEATIPAISEANGLEQAELVHNYEENNLGERAEVSHYPTDVFGEKKVSDNSEGPVGSSSSSSSSSDSESDSSDSGSDSGTHSRSRSKSARGSGSGSSSDSGSEASNKSKEAFDEDVDIMTSDDDKQVKHKLGASEVGGSFKSPPLWPTSDGEHARALSDEKQYGHTSDTVDIEIDSPEDQHMREVDVPNDSVRKQGGQKAVEETVPSSYYHHEDQEKHEYAARLQRESGNVSKNRSKHTDGSEKSSRGKHKSASVEKHGDKKSRSRNSQQPLVPGSRMAPLPESQQMLSPDRPSEDVTRGHSNQMGNRSRGDINSSFGSLKIVDQTSSGKSVLDSQPAQRSVDPTSRVKTSIPVEKPGKGVDTAVRSAKNTVKVSKEDFTEKNKTPVEHHYRSAVNGRPLQRELSGLEMGEIGESLPEEASGGGKQLSRKSSFKQSENWKPDSSKAKPMSKINMESRLSSPPNANIAVSVAAEGIPKGRGFPEHSAGDNLKPHPRGSQTHARHQSRVDNVDNGTQLNRLVESSGRTRHADARKSLNNTPELNGSFPSKGVAITSQEHEPRQVAATSKKDKRRQKNKGVPDLNNKQKDNSLTGSSDGHQKRIESSSDENSCPYSKYEKEKPELKQPIKDWDQYTEYVDEFDEKYGAYISLNNILESYRQEFLQYERDLEAAKGKDMKKYKEIEEQIKESYRQCGERFKRLKNIFGVLHVELEHLKRMIHDFGTPYLKG